MKCLLLLVAVFCITNSEAKYVFNFSSGPTSIWNDASNWVGGVVPVSADSVIILPPDENYGYTCIMDEASVSCGMLFSIEKKATLIVLAGATISFTSHFSVGPGAALDLHGSILKICPSFFSNLGKITIEPGGGISNEESSYCPDYYSRSSFGSSGTLVNYGYLGLNTTDFGSSGTFINNGYIDKNLKGDMRLSEGAVNNGTISGNGSLFATGLTNNGTIDLSGNNFYPTIFFSEGSLVNNGNIFCDGDFGFKKSLYNKGTISSTASDYYNNRSISFDSAMVINDGTFDITTEYPVSFTGSLTNNKTFFIGYDGFIPFKMSIVNNDRFGSSTAHFVGGSVINNKIMELTANIDTTIIKIPFINKGTMYTTGPIKFNETFINSGELITQ